MKRKELTFLILTFMMVFTNASAKPLKLWYNQPAKVWEEALPLGNSRVGAMVYGIPHQEEIQLNEETIWGGGPYRNDNPKSLEALPVIRQMIFDGKHHEANDLANQTFLLEHMGCLFKQLGV